MAEAQPRWRRLFAIADAAVGEFADQWQAWFRNLQRALRHTDFTEVLAAPNSLAASQLISQVVQRTVETPARKELPSMASQVVEDAGQATTQAITPPRVEAPPYVTGLPETAQWIDQHVGVQIRDVSQTTMLTVRQTLQSGWREGLHPRVLARQIRGMTGLTPRQAGAIAKQEALWQAQGMRAAPLQKAVRQLQERAIRQRAETIARTETLAYSNYGAHSAIEQYVRRGVISEAELVRNWLPTTDRSCCSECTSIPGMNPNGVGLNEEFHTPFGPLLLPPAHPNCVTGDTLVLPGGRISATSKRWYDGEVIVLRTAQEKHLTCTPNHPILTWHGWVPAGQLIEGGNVVCYRRQQGIASVDQDIEHMPACVEEIVETFGLSAAVASCEVPIAPEAFHGDGEGSQVAIIGTNRLLRDDLDPPLIEHGSYQVFQSRYSQLFLLARLGTPFYPLNGLGFATDRIMGSLDLAPALLVGHVRPFDDFSLALAPWDNVMPQQETTDDRTRDMVAFSNAFLGDTFQIETDYLVSIERRNFRGHVFNLQTELGWYSGNAIVTHNCRCTVTTSARG